MGPANPPRDTKSHQGEKTTEATWRGLAPQPGGSASTPHRISLRLSARLPLEGGVTPGSAGVPPAFCPCRRFRPRLRTCARGQVLSPPSRLNSYAKLSMGLRPRLSAAVASPLHSNPGRPARAPRRPSSTQKTGYMVSITPGNQARRLMQASRSLPPRAGGGQSQSTINNSIISPFVDNPSREIHLH